ncbi:GNAT family N-acetyltransferase [Deinococcus planocerae]|uniref:GNAT family N-acetyltransferase n=1 Tax=Deinococcus planocerae TaxID=1737569 RepID=UPI000C7EEDF8|nr:GNAT family N-acetyltransferase [Deinococcus planocerae]
MQIQTADPSHLDLLLPLFAAYQRFYRAQPDEARNRAFLARLLATLDLGVQYLALGNQGPLGFATLYFPLSSVSAQPSCLLNDLFVIPKARGAGTGRALIERARQHAAEARYATLRWQTEQANETAQRLYDGLGTTRTAWFTYSLPTGV